MNNIHNSINRYDRIIILITDQSASKGWFTFAVVSSLENIIVENHMRLLVAYKGNRREDVGFLKTGLLSLTPKTFVDLTEWQGYERLLKQLNTPVCLDEELPAGNLHLGLVHSHISGYMCYVAEEQELIKHANNELYVCAQVPTTITAISNLAKQHLGKINVALEHQRFCQSYQQIIEAKGWGDFLEIVPCEGI
ncbi:hypothetical protein DPMN_028877 [Dreissena polymorpha]|uniref:Uncharacterized protein n=1 Tax=Dreissena polymorpha TaxID=45954 RepID=A0A9D4LY30_DREPO|nr:hypothetical protein DPMN_028877 [Dreissena polymorpha]